MPDGMALIIEPLSIFRIRLSNAVNTDTMARPSAYGILQLEEFPHCHVDLHNM